MEHTEENPIEQDAEKPQHLKASSGAHFATSEGEATPEGGADPEGEPEKPRKSRARFVRRVLLAVAAVIALAGVGVALWVHGLESSMSVSEEDRAALDAELVESSAADVEPFYVLIIGSDARKNDTVSRSDTLMLARVDVSEGAVSLVSIPRDTMVVNQYGAVDKINASFVDGPAATVRAVSEFAGVQISHYVEVHFSGVRDVVDALGGITVNVPEDISDRKAKLELSAGEQVLDGATALRYARARFGVTGGDFGRAQAQRQIVEAIVDEVLASSPLELPFVVNELAESITTDLSVTDIVSYATAFQQAASDGVTFYSASVPSYAYDDITGVSYVATMYDEWRAMMQRMDAGLDLTDETAVIPAEQLANADLGAATNAAGPRDYAALAAVSGLTTDDVAPLEDETAAEQGEAVSAEDAPVEGEPEADPSAPAEGTVQ